MDKRCKHLGSEERGVILAEDRQGSSLREIGVLLGRAPSTIGRGLARGRLEDASYSPQVAREIYDARRVRCGRRAKLAEGAALHDRVRGKLVHLRWSPEQIAARLRAMHPDDPSARVSHETRLSRDLRAAQRGAEGGDARRPAATRTDKGAQTHDPRRQRHGPGIIADYSPA